MPTRVQTGLASDTHHICIQGRVQVIPGKCEAGQVAELPKPRGRVSPRLGNLVLAVPEVRTAKKLDDIINPASQQHSYSDPATLMSDVARIPPLVNQATGVGEIVSQ